jgi:predicted secreted protein
VELGQSDNGRRLDVGVDDRLVVRLPETGGTGYVWQVASLSGPARLVSDSPEPASVPAPGASGSHRWEIAFDGSGPVALRAVHRRPWEPEANAVDEYRLDLVVA